MTSASPPSAPVEDMGFEGNLQLEAGEREG